MLRHALHLSAYRTSAYTWFSADSVSYIKLNCALYKKKKTDNVSMSKLIMYCLLAHGHISEANAKTMCQAIKYNICSHGIMH